MHAAQAGIEAAKRAAVEQSGFGGPLLGDAWFGGQTPATTAEAEAMVQGLWDRIDAPGLADRYPVGLDLPPPGATAAAPRRNWVEIRVFVSSTFADMHAEREVLVRKVGTLDVGISTGQCD